MLEECLKEWVPILWAYGTTYKVTTGVTSFLLSYKAKTAVSFENRSCILKG